MGKIWNKTKTDLDQLRVDIQKMSRYSKLWFLLREELTKLDHWKNQPRGNPKKAHAMRGKKNGEF
jgi:hypothetical protein